MPVESGLLADRYELRRRLGAGPVGQVWEGDDHQLGVRVAVKTFHAHLADDETFRAGAVRAAEHAARVRHPGVAAVRDPGDGRFVVTDYVGGPSVRVLLDGQGLLHPEDVVELAFDACTALSAAHEQGVVHRNLKPENLLVVSGCVTVTDFALAATVPGAGLLTAARYLAPELTLTGRGDARSDLYALGCCLYEMVTGRPPFDGPTPSAVAAKHAGENPPSPSAAGARISPELEAVIGRTFARDPDDRYQTAMQLREALQQVAVQRIALPSAAPPQPAAAPQPAPRHAAPQPAAAPPAAPRHAAPAADRPPVPGPPPAPRARLDPLALMEADGGAGRPGGRGDGAADEPAAPGRLQAAAPARGPAPVRGTRLLSAVVVAAILAVIMTGLVTLVGPVATAKQPPATAPDRPAPASTAPASSSP